VWIEYAPMMTQCLTAPTGNEAYEPRWAESMELRAEEDPEQNMQWNDASTLLILARQSRPGKSNISRSRRLANSVCKCSQ
jgi:hypothetical protein